MLAISVNDILLFMDVVVKIELKMSTVNRIFNVNAHATEIVC